MEASTDKSESAILARALGPLFGNLSPELAEHVLASGWTEADKQAPHELAQLAKVGVLSEEQSAELENYRRAGRIFVLIQVQGPPSAPQRRRRTLMKNRVDSL